MGCVQTRKRRNVHCRSCRQSATVSSFTPIHHGPLALPPPEALHNSEDDHNYIYVAMYDFEPHCDQDLQLKTGDRVRVVDKRDRDWWLVQNLRTLEKGHAPSVYLSPLNSLSAESWYHRTISRRDAERFLLRTGLPRGSFLVRQCETNPSSGFLSLSVRDVLQSQCCEQVKHYKIRSIFNESIQSRTYFIDSKRPFLRVSDLIKHYSTYSDGLCCRLTQPCSRPRPSNTGTLGVDIWEVPRSSVQLLTKLGHGMFGEVWQGRWNDRIDVAVKCLRPGSMSSRAFLLEATIMKRLRHDKLVQLYAVCSDMEPIYIITEYMANGSLLNYLRSPLGTSLSIVELVDYASQIALGMSYLEKQNFVHRDLAARNVLVGDDGKTVKIADFGLARFLNNGEEYMAHEGSKFPIKWTAPEAASQRKFTIKSDVWSYGIVLMEITSYGQVPYPGMNAVDVVDQLQKGYRMPKPSTCPDAMYSIILKCWEADPQKRPTFEYLQVFFDDFFVATQPSYQQT
ncbi:hypothetical protein ACOME3_005452 [Neoechinorhynchus agilis]